VPHKLRKQHLFQRLSGVFGMLNASVRFPVEAAYDTVTVARKPEVPSYLESAAWEAVAEGARERE
jgi:hypothetical protein